MGVRVGPFDPSLEWPEATGVDEAGRGPLCGPVVVAGARFDPALVPARMISMLDDSKRMTAKARAEAYSMAMACDAISIAVAAASAREIDRIGIRAATLACMAKVAARLGSDLALFDGVDVPDGIPMRGRAVVKGDSKVPQIACASIVAKETRDRAMARLDPRHPGYGWARNSGYGSKEHMEALERLGPTPHHRFSFKPVAESAAKARP